MRKEKNTTFLRIAHKYLGLILGIQFILWTASGIYFSWTNLDRIHGDHFKTEEFKPNYYNNLFPISDLITPNGIRQIELRDINNMPFYWINDSILFNALTGQIKKEITELEASAIAKKHMKSSLQVKSIHLISEADKHHEYRNRPLPAYVISYDHPDEVKAYVSKLDGKFQTLRHRSWRWFDFLWMTHTMDYNGRDNFNTFLLRAFSLLGLATVLSGILIWISKTKT